MSELIRKSAEAKYDNDKSNMEGYLPKKEDIKKLRKRINNLEKSNEKINKKLDLIIQRIDDLYDDDDDDEDFLVPFDM